LPDGEDFAPLGLFLGRIWHDDAAHGLFAFLEALNDETVVKRSDFHVTPGLVVEMARAWLGIGQAPVRRRDISQGTRRSARSLFRTAHRLARMSGTMLWLEV
jgi:hypothetical protein